MPPRYGSSGLSALRIALSTQILMIGWTDSTYLKGLNLTWAAALSVNKFFYINMVKCAASPEHRCSCTSFYRSDRWPRKHAQSTCWSGESAGISPVQTPDGSSSPLCCCHQKLKKRQEKKMEEGKKTSVVQVGFQVTLDALDLWLSYNSKEQKLPFATSWNLSFTSLIFSRAFMLGAVVWNSMSSTDVSASLRLCRQASASSSIWSGSWAAINTHLSDVWGNCGFVSHPEFCSQARVVND